MNFNEPKRKTTFSFIHLFAGWVFHTSAGFSWRIIQFLQLEFIHSTFPLAVIRLSQLLRSLNMMAGIRKQHEYTAVNSNHVCLHSHSLFNYIMSNISSPRERLNSSCLLQMTFIYIYQDPSIKEMLLINISVKQL